MHLRGYRGLCALETRTRRLRPIVLLVAEALESRQLLSTVSATVLAQPTTGMVEPTAQPTNGPTVLPLASSSTTSYPYTPAQVRKAYGFDNLNGIPLVGNGAGQTIAIIDAYHDPSIAQDLANFDSQFGLATAKLTVVGQTGSPYQLPTTTDPSGWGIETALDVEWAHAIAPGANILLVEANSASWSDLLAAVNFARNYTSGLTNSLGQVVPPVSVVSMSFGSGEFWSEASYDSYFTTPAGHQGVTFVASSGDSGGVVEYPAASPNVLSVGGTSLLLNANGSWSSGTTGWSGSGGGVSAVETKPSYQSSLSYSRRATPDVAYDASSSPGFYVASGGGWYRVGGTSAGAPQWASLIAIADQARQTSGSLSGSSQTLPFLYQYLGNSSAFHDITSGRAGRNSARTGYDLVTGIGEPFASYLISAAATWTGVSGSVATNLVTSGSTGHGRNFTRFSVVTASAGSDLAVVSVAAPLLVTPPAPMTMPVVPTSPTESLLNPPSGSTLPNQGLLNPLWAGGYSTPPAALGWARPGPSPSKPAPDPRANPARPEVQPQPLDAPVEGDPLPATIWDEAVAYLSADQPLSLPLTVSPLALALPGIPTTGPTWQEAALSASLAVLLWSAWQTQSTAAADSTRTRTRSRSRFACSRLS